MPLEDVLSEARKLFPRKRALPEFSLVISHRMRRSINKRCNEQLKPADALKLEGEDVFYVYPGQRLVGHLQEKKRGVLNNAFYIVKTVADEITIKCEISGKEFKLPHDFVAQYLRLSHALTIAGIQGATLGSIRIFTNHPRFTLRHLFVAISRATSYAAVEVI